MGVPQASTEGKDLPLFREEMGSTILIEELELTGNT